MPLQPHLWQLMLLTLAVLLFSGLPVGLVLAGVGLGFGVLGCGLGLMAWNDFGFIFHRIFGALFDTEDIVWSAVPLLLFMGLALHHSGIADEMLTCLQRLLRRVPGGLALAALLMGVVLAPAAGMIGASVVTLTLIALPEMLTRGYRSDYAAGTVAAAGTLGVALPPGVMLFFIAEAMGVYTPFVFLAMAGPELLLLGLYAGYCVLAAWWRPELAPPPPTEVLRQVSPAMVLRSLLLPLALIVVVLLAITVGWVPMAGAAAIGAGGVLLLCLVCGRASAAMLNRVVTGTATITAMVFFIFMGASVFNLVFRLLGGVDAVAGFLAHLSLGSWGTLGLILLVLFGLGFFVDWIELVMVSFAIFRPAIDILDFSSLIHQPVLAYSWITVLITLTLQVSFLTPPFGYALFFLKGAAPRQVRMADIYRGIVPFVLLHLLAIGCVASYPAIATWLPGKVLSLKAQQKVHVNEP